MRKGEIDIITLGCSKNLVDAERLMRQLELAGYRCVHDSPQPKGEIAIINTCGFIGDAKEESIEMILQFADRKNKGKLSKLYVMGCLSQRYAKELPAEIPEVDGWFGKFDFFGIVEECASAQFRERPEGYGLEFKGNEYERMLTTPSHYAYLKIAEGCNRYCSYCAIPLITGKFTSRTIEDILEEVKWLVSKGVKEFNVIAQDLSSYGLDLYGEHRLAQLLDQMAQVDGVNGHILLPDAWAAPSGMAFKVGLIANDNVKAENYASFQILSADDWKILEDRGAVFLPAGGQRYDTNDVRNVGIVGEYWAGPGLSRDYYPFSVQMLPSRRGIYVNEWFNVYGLAVRLVKD